MIVTSESVDIVVGGSPMRMLVSAPKDDGAHPGVVMYSDIFQITPTQVRASTRLASYGFVVATPEIYHRVEAPGAAFPFNDEGRDRGQRDAAATSVAEFDADFRAALAYLESHPRVRADRLGVAGFCTGGHLAFRGALDRRVRATVCFYPTGLHDGKLGKDADAGTLARVPEIAGELLLVFGTRDPHVPEAGRAKIRSALEAAKTRHAITHYEAEHAFMRDEGPRYDPEAADDAWREAIALFRRALSA
jgi:carboxymethylenebutenolidase